MGSFLLLVFISLLAQHDLGLIFEDGSVDNGLGGDMLSQFASIVGSFPNRNQRDIVKKVVFSPNDSKNPLRYEGYARLVDDLNDFLKLKVGIWDVD